MRSRLTWRKGVPISHLLEDSIGVEGIIDATASIVVAH